MNLHEKSIAIVGIGREGLATLRFLRQRLPSQRLTVCDQQSLEKLPEETKSLLDADENLTYHFGSDYRNHLRAYDVIIKSAGIPLKTVLPFAQKENITSPTQLFFDACPGAIIGVTGTKGKSTTTTVIYEVLQTGKKPVVLCGNIGKAALDFLPEITKETVVVMELSSHQLQTVTKSPHVAVLQNIVPEHLDYYNNFAEYVLAKENITKFQTDKDYLLYNADYPIPYEIAHRSQAKRIPFNAELGRTCCFVRNGEIVYRYKGDEEMIMETKEVGLTGEFNIQNILPSIIIGKLYGTSNNDIKHVIVNFKGLKDRLEFVGTFDGVSYYNDSLSTVPEATIAAIEAFEPNVATLIAGGYDRGLNFENLAKKIVSSGVQTIILFPTTGQKIWNATEKELTICDRRFAIRHYIVDSMSDAVKLAKEHTPKGKVCLLSPASPSFGVFKDYHDRGEQFKKLLL